MNAHKGENVSISLYFMKSEIFYCQYDVVLLSLCPQQF